MGILSTWSHWSDREERTRRLLSPEFLLYYITLAYGYFRVTAHLVNLSEEAADKMRGLHWNKWLGRKTDMSDAQSSMFRNNFLILLAVMASFVLIRWILLRVASYNAQHPHTKQARTALSPEATVRVASGIVFALVFMLVLHGAATLFILAIVVMNFAIARWTAAAGRTRPTTKPPASTSATGLSLTDPSQCNPGFWLQKAAPIITWTFNVAVLLLNDHYNGYRFAAIHPALGWLDGHRGLYQWHVGFNMVTLHMISYNMDYLWFRTKRESTVNWEKHESSCEVCMGSPSETCYMRRQETHCAHASGYSFWMYLAYIFYIPLYLAGPIVTFNAFASQTLSPSRSTATSLVKYGLRFLLNYVLLEVMCAYLYILAINQSPYVWKDYTPWEIGMLSYFTIQFLWLKFNVIWKFFRWVAMLDGMETVENMPRCVNNHYSISGFWRNWHRSYNRWLIRYLYIPMGGSRNRLAAVGVTFTFVALWHDITLKLLIWGWAVTLLFAPEMIAQWICRVLRWRPGRKVMAAFAALNIFWMIVANVLGFSVGVDGMKQMLEMMFANTMDAGIFLLVCWYYLYVGASMMLEIRKIERARAAERQIQYVKN